MVRGISLSVGQPPNPMLFSGPIECRIREVLLYVQIHLCVHGHAGILQYTNSDIV